MKTLFKITIIAIMAFSLTRCSVINTASLVGTAAGGKNEGKSVAYDYETNLTKKSELISACLSVGQELGYTVETQTPDFISWKVAQTNRVQEYFGKHSSSSLHTGILWNEDKNKQTLRISSNIVGNYSQAQKSKVDSLITNFETKLLQYLEKSDHSLKRID